ncbi:MAG: cation diffusion facilitator family transporter [Bauldia sp.]
MQRILEWFGLKAAVNAGGAGQDDAGDHGHTHGVVDASISTTTRGIWALKWSFVILAITAAMQVIVVVISASVALLADTIHNLGDATTAIPLWIAFLLARRKPSSSFSYGLGRVEDLAGVIVVLVILASGLLAGYEAINRLINPEPITSLGWVAVAGALGFLGNEFVAYLRIRVGKEINSAALIADGYHARTDGFTSLAVVLGALGVWLGFPLADPIIGLLITLTIFVIVWQSAKAVFSRMLDGVEPSVIDEIKHAAEHIPEIRDVVSARARWTGHRMRADIVIRVDPGLVVAHANSIAEQLKEELFHHFVALTSINVEVQPALEYPSDHHAPAPVRVASDLADGVLQIADTAGGERMVLRIGRHTEGLSARVAIDRPGGIEELILLPTADNHHRLESTAAPAEPHEFQATLYLKAGERTAELPFSMAELDDHVH